MSIFKSISHRKSTSGGNFGSVIYVALLK